MSRCLFSALAAFAALRGGESMRKAGTIVGNRGWQPLARFVFHKANAIVVKEDYFDAIANETRTMTWPIKETTWGKVQWVGSGASLPEGSYAYIELAYPTALAQTMGVQLIWDELPESGSSPSGRRPGIDPAGTLELREFGDGSRWSVHVDYLRGGWTKMSTVIALGTREPKRFWVAVVSSSIFGTDDCVCRVENECNSLCRDSLDGVEYNIDMRNGGFDMGKYPLSHFSHDEVAALPLAVVFIVLQIALLVFGGTDLFLLGRSNKLHPSALAPLFSIWAQFFSMLFANIRCIVVKESGALWASRVLQGFERVFGGIAEVSLIAGIIVLAKGLGITRRKLGNASWKKICAFVAVYAATWLLMFIWATLACVFSMSLFAPSSRASERAESLNRPAPRPIARSRLSCASPSAA